MSSFTVPFPGQQVQVQPQIGYQYGAMPGQPQYTQAYQTQHQPPYQGHNPGIYQQHPQAAQYVQVRVPPDLAARRSANGFLDRSAWLRGLYRITSSQWRHRLPARCWYVGLIQRLFDLLFTVSAS